MHSIRYLLMCLVMCLAAAGWSGAARPHDYGTGMLMIDHPWAPPTADTAMGTGAGTGTATAYLTIENSGQKDDTLLAVTIPATVAGAAHLSDASAIVAGGMTVPAGGRLVFEPGGRHILLTGLKRPLDTGMTFNGTLIFEAAGRIEVEFWVEQPDAQARKGNHHDHH